jgi:hypothetical protein
MRASWSANGPPEAMLRLFASSVARRRLTCFAGLPWAVGSDRRSRGRSQLSTHSFALAGLGCLALGRLFERCERFVPETIEPAAQGFDAAGVHSIETARAFDADYD